MSLRNLYTPPKSLYADSLNYHRDPNMFVSLTLLTQFINILFAILYITQNKPTSFYIIVVSVLSMGINGIYFKKTGNFKNAFAIYSFLVLLIISFDHMVEPAYNGSNLFWYAPCLFSAFYLLDRKRAIMVSCAGFLMFTGGYLYKHFHVFPVTINTTTPEQALVINIVTMFLTTITIYFISRFFFQEESLVKEKLRDLSASNASLLSILTHDLSSPAMVASMSLKKSRESQKAYDRVERSLQKITDIVNDTRELHALGTGKREIELVDTSVRDTLVNTLKDYTHLANAKGIEIVVDDQLERDCQIRVEPNSLQNNVLSNLISNAVKFSHPGGKVIVSAKKKNSDVILSVEDSGVGIPLEIQEHLFDFSVPTSRNGTLGEQGTGFGMPIVKMFMDLYHATIHVESCCENQGDKSGTRFDLIFSNNN